MTPKGKTPHFSLRPHPIPLVALVLVVISGGLVALSFFEQEDGTGVYKHKGIITAIITFFLAFCFLFAATAMFWFPHLWKKNSTHARHCQHTKNHPVMKNDDFRRKRHKSDFQA